jgi:predicted DNA-binding protein (MmcQ/YjbR family)
VASPFGRMNATGLRRHSLSFPGSAETFPFGPEASVFKVGEKMFAISRLASKPLEVSLKCEPQLAEQLREAHPSIRPGYHLNKRHWNTVEFDGSVPDEELLDLIDHSYDLIVTSLTKAQRDSLPPRP